ncbi:DUF1214 domain-containing protein [Nocardia sp. NPDC050630]|uniref:DUF1214 domain-containing protein n=1 Tax=Nocardia sp. NPDC050630 TaxID=3364321 RepID=UPI0037B84F5E
MKEIREGRAQNRSVELTVQQEAPGVSVPGNWLPIPASGQFSLTTGLYAPKDIATDGHWLPPAPTVVP